ncbi:MAG: hypothetical protein K2O89_02130 [Clostridia bacterium]|nr:hypothetical protein [Clostridia bacterium]
MRNEELGVVGVLQELSRDIEREKSPFTTDSDFNYGLDTAINKIKSLLDDTARLADNAVTLYEPTVANVCLRLQKSENVGELEVSRLLDALLGFCFDERIVEQYRRVCKVAVLRHASLVADYIRYYIEMWETKED